MSSRRAHRLRLLAAAAVVALAPALLVVAWPDNAGVRGSFPSPRIIGTTGAPVGGDASATASRSPAVGTPPTGRPTGRPAPRPLTVRYPFDGGLTTRVPDAAGLLPLVSREAAGGSLSAIPRAGGLAVRFPAPCPGRGSARCARAILQSARADFLNPASSPFKYGVSVRMVPEETSKGANLVQKGYAVGDSQFKLQVDGAAGLPSCVLVGRDGERVYLAQASVSVADGEWHDIQCARRDQLLTVSVDGAIRGRQTVPSSLSIVNADPLCVGGKGTSADNDQFHGSLDDVYVTLEPRLIG